MKKILLFLALFTCATSWSYAQADKANTIVITVSDSNTVKQKVTAVFTDREYTFAPGKNPSLLSTAAKTLKSGTRVSYQVQLKGAEVVLSGKIMVAGQSNMIIVNNGAKGSPFVNGWEEMEKIAKAIGGKVKYENR